VALGASQDDGEELDLDDGEVLIRKGKANHFVGSISDGGRLRLTNRRLIFRAHRVNLARVSGTIAVADVVDFVTGRAPTDLTLVLTDGKTERFALWHRRHWIADIKAAAEEARVYRA
jgi:hypothetical protein